jgi:hypothetical protein
MTNGLRIVCKDGAVIDIDIEETITILYSTLCTSIDAINTMLKAHTNTLGHSELVMGNMIARGDPNEVALIYSVYTATKNITPIIDTLNTLTDFRRGMEKQMLSIKGVATH